MSDASNTKLLRAYFEESEAPMFLSGFFQTPPENIHSTEKVEIDIERDDNDIAIAVTDLTSGSRQNETNKYVNKGYTPPIFDEAGTITSYDMIKRMAGQNPFSDPDFAFNATTQSFRVFRKLERKIRRSVELMSSQVFQDGTVTLVDESSNTLYQLDFGMKSTHKITVGTTWAVNGGSGDPLGDVEAAAIVVRRDGKRKPDRLIFGTSAAQRFLANTDVQARLDNRNFQLGQIAPEMRGEGSTFMGRVWIGQYLFEMWMYDGFYKDPATGNHTPYVSDNNVIMTSSGARLDLSYGMVPILVSPEQRAMNFLPPQMNDSSLGLALTTNSWFTPDGKHLMVSASTRPLTIPTAIDTYARITVVA